MFGRLRAPRRSLAVAVLAATACLVPAAAPASAANFPSWDSGYHSFSEMVDEIHATADAHPDIVRVFSIGKSYQGRDIWAAKISDNVGTDENEPEILFDALHHAREHLTVEQALYLFHLLVDGYGKDAKITGLVNNREIWIIFAVNPDGFEYDLTCTHSSHPPFCAWRKNRQPNAGTTAIGTDLNRNYDYHWGCCGGSSGNPSSITYRGPRALSSPEVRAVRAFVLSRVINGIQQIKAHITFHTNGQLILWPYGYTRTDIPSSMTVLDHAAFVTMGRKMASLNGYKAEQSSDLYITDGDEIDFLYGRQRIFSYTWELYPPETGTVWGDHYPDDSRIASATANNRSALIYFLSVGWCPYSVLGLRAQDCGPFFDDAEIARGWTINPDGTDTARSSSAFARGDPAPTSYGGHSIQPGSAADGRYAYVTGLAAGTSAGSNDLDGTTTMRSAPISLPPVVGPLTFRYVWAHGPSSTSDHLQVAVEDESGTRTTVWRRAGTASIAGGAWATASASLAPWAGHTIRLVIQATDGGHDSLVEAAVDDVRVQRATGT